MKIHLAALILIAFCATVTAQQRSATTTPAHLSRNAFSFKGKVVALKEWGIDYKQVSETEYVIAFGSGIFVKVTPFLKYQLFARGTRGRTLYVSVDDVVDGMPIISILGNHVEYDINAVAKYVWKENGDK
ncbi:MAG: hypothetical protein WCK55_09935 [Verrucomicrobiota bacterium]